jgi:uncharacterized protein
MSGSGDRGWKFPVMIDKSTGRILMSEDEEDVHESIMIIIKTIRGERVMRKGFGSNVNRYVFEHSDSSTLTLIEEEIMRAIVNWEPRVFNVMVRASNDKENPEKIFVWLNYEVRKNDRRYEKTFTLDI